MGAADFFLALRVLSFVMGPPAFLVSYLNVRRADRAVILVSRSHISGIRSMVAVHLRDVARIRALTHVAFFAFACLAIAQGVIVEPSPEQIARVGIVVLAQMLTFTNSMLELFYALRLDKRAALETLAKAQREAI